MGVPSVPCCSPTLVWIANCTECTYSEKFGKLTSTQSHYMNSNTSLYCIFNPLEQLILQHYSMLFNNLLMNSGAFRNLWLFGNSAIYFKRSIYITVTLKPIISTINVIIGYTSFYPWLNYIFSFNTVCPWTIISHQ